MDAANAAVERLKQVFPHTDRRRLARLAETASVLAHRSVDVLDAQFRPESLSVERRKRVQEGLFAPLLDCIAEGVQDV